MRYFNNLCIAGALVLLLGVPSTLSQAAPSSQGLPPPIVPQGFGVAVHFRPASDAQIARFGDTGYGFARTDLKWAMVETKAGQYDFSAYDKLTDQLDAKHCRAMYILDYANPLYDNNLSPHTPEGRAAFARFAAAAATHFKDRGVIWEIWNEPNGATFWKPTPSATDYTLMAIDTARAIHKADSAATVLAPGGAGVPLPYLETAFKMGLLKEIDGVSVHPYRHTAPELSIEDYRALRTLIAAYTPVGQPQRPVIDSEWGYSTQEGGLPEDAQARYLTRKWLSNLAYGVNLSIYYDWADDGIDPKDAEHHFGTLRHDLTDKPANVAAKSLIAALTGYRYMHRLPGANTNDWRLVFSKGDTLALVTWNADTKASPEAQTPRVRQVSASDPEYAKLSHIAAIDYPSGPRVATAMSNASLPITVTNPDSTAATVRVTVGATTQMLKLAPNASKTVTVTMPVTPNLAMTSVPVQVAWNGKPVTDLPPVETLTASLLSITVDPMPGGLLVHATNHLAPFHGTLRINSGGTIKTAPLDLSALGSHDITFKADPTQVVRISAIDAQGRACAITEPIRFVPVADLPKQAGEVSGFKVTPFVKNVPMTAPPTAQLVPGETDAPAPVVISMPYGLSPEWLYTELRPEPAIAIPAGAKELIVWIKGKATGARLGIRFKDTTGQIFGPGGGQMDWDGWRAVHVPMTGSLYSWGGANDGIFHGQLTWDSLLILDGTHLPLGTEHVLIAAPYYAMPE